MSLRLSRGNRRGWTNAIAVPIAAISQERQPSASVHAAFVRKLKEVESAAPDPVQFGRNASRLSFNHSFHSDNAMRKGVVSIFNPDIGPTHFRARPKMILGDFSGL
jgi:hypothetical protein